MPQHYIHYKCIVLAANYSLKTVAQMNQESKTSKEVLKTAANMRQFNKIIHIPVLKII